MGLLTHCTSRSSCGCMSCVKANTRATDEARMSLVQACKRCFAFQAFCTHILPLVVIAGAYRGTSKGAHSGISKGDPVNNTPVPRSGPHKDIVTVMVNKAGRGTQSVQVPQHDTAKQVPATPPGTEHLMHTDRAQADPLTHARRIHEHVRQCID